MQHYCTIKDYRPPAGLDKTLYSGNVKNTLYTGCFPAICKSETEKFTGGYRSSKPFFLTLQTGLKFPVDKRSIKDAYYSQFQQQEKMGGIAVCLISCARGFLKKWSCHLQLHFSQSFLHQFEKTHYLSF